MRLIWTSDARRDLGEILGYIAAHNGTASVRLLQIIEETVDRLPEHPYMYRRGRVDGTREAVVHPNYVVIYRVLEDAVAILAVIHTRQEYP